MSAIKTVFRKAAYCIGCRVCEANCPNGFISMHDGTVTIDDACIKCKKCHDVYHGCLLANSTRLPKGEKKMGSIDRYGNMGIEYTWVVEYFKKKDDFWGSAHGLGTNMVKYLKSFLNDSEVTVKGKFSDFGRIIDSIGIETTNAWALLLCNLAYTSEFNWWLKNIDFVHTYMPDEIYTILDDSMSANSRSHIVSAYKNILISNSILSLDIGMGNCEYEIKNGKRRWISVSRTPWMTPTAEVVLYSLYKFADACGGYRQFTLSRLFDQSAESDGVSPTQIFGLDRDTMEKLLNGLTFSYPDLIEARFTLGLDSITLKSEKKAEEILEELF